MPFWNGTLLWRRKYSSIFIRAPRLFSVWAGTTPARVVSGDLYDFLPFRDGKVGLLCADVSGKGVSAALMMSHLQALARGRLLSVDESRVQPRAAAFVTGFNRDLRGRFGNNRYATMFYAEFDWRSRLLRYINAGHCPPILISKTGEPIKLTEGDLPVGLLSQAKYEELEVDLIKRGHRHCVYRRESPTP